MLHPYPNGAKGVVSSWEFMVTNAVADPEFMQETGETAALREKYVWLRPHFVKRAI